MVPITQFFAVGDIHTIKSVSGDSTKVYAWLAGNICAVLYLHGPEALGGQGNIRIKAEEEAERTGRPYEEVCMKVRQRLAQTLTLRTHTIE